MIYHWTTNLSYNSHVNFLVILTSIRSWRFQARQLNLRTMLPILEFYNIKQSSKMSKLATMISLKCWLNLSIIWQTSMSCKFTKNPLICARNRPKRKFILTFQSKRMQNLVRWKWTFSTPFIWREWTLYWQQTSSRSFGSVKENSLSVQNIPIPKYQNNWSTTSNSL